MLIGNLLSFTLIILLAIFLLTGLLRLSPFIIQEVKLFPIINFSDGLNSTEFFVLELIVGGVSLFMITLCIFVFFLPALLSGYFAGNMLRGMISAILLGFFTGVILFLAGSAAEILYGEINIFWFFLLYSPLLLLIAITCGLFGGYVKQRLKLYPLEKEIILEMTITKRRTT